MFGQIIFGTLPFASIQSEGEVDTGQLWIDQCKAIQPWENQTAKTIETVRCNNAT